MVEEWNDEGRIRNRGTLEQWKNGMVKYWIIGK